MLDKSFNFLGKSLLCANASGIVINFAIGKLLFVLTRSSIVESRAAESEAVLSIIGFQMLPVKMKLVILSFFLII